MAARKPKPPQPERLLTPAEQEEAEYLADLEPDDEQAQHDRAFLVARARQKAKRQSQTPKA